MRLADLESNGKVVKVLGHGEGEAHVNLRECQVRESKRHGITLIAEAHQCGS